MSFIFSHSCNNIPYGRGILFIMLVDDSCFESPKNFGVYLRDGQNHEVGVVDGITQPDCKALEGFLYLLVSHSGIA